MQLPVCRLLKYCFGNNVKGCCHFPPLSGPSCHAALQFRFTLWQIQFIKVLKPIGCSIDKLTLLIGQGRGVGVGEYLCGRQKGANFVGHTPRAEKTTRCGAARLHLKWHVCLSTFLINFTYIIVIVAIVVVVWLWWLKYLSIGNIRICFVVVYVGIRNSFFLLLLMMFYIYCM